MSNFRIKKDKNKKSKDKKNTKGHTTLDKKHKQHVKKFKVRKKSIIKLNKELDKLNKELNIVNKKKSNSEIFDLPRRAEILNRIDYLKEEINIINENIYEMDYYDKAGDLITDYYEVRDKTNKKIVESKSILEYLNTNKKSINSTEKNRANIFDKFCKRVDGIRINIRL